MTSQKTPPSHQPKIKDLPADDVMLATEMKQLMKPHPRPWSALPPPSDVLLVPLGNEAAEARFLCRAEELGIA